MRLVGDGGIIVPGCRLVEPGLYGPSWAKYLAGPVGNGRGGSMWPRACTATLKFRDRDSRASMEILGAAAAEGKKSGCLIKAKQPIIN